MAADNEKRKMKTVEDSRTEWTKLLRYGDINGSGRLFGGRLMEWIDEIAGVAAIRHCGHEVTTACVDYLEFKKGAYRGEMIVMIARVTHVGRTSMEVRVDTWLETPADGKRYPINHAFLTEVCVDSEGHPLPIEYGLTLETEAQKAEWAAAEYRKTARRKWKESYLHSQEE